MPPNKYDYDDDDVGSDYGEDYGEDEELSPEDQAAMEHGTAEVRAALGKNASKITLKQIQDALWNYYYDVDKSVAFLNKTYLATAPKPTPAAAPKKKTPEGMCEDFSFSAAHCLFGGVCGAEHQRLAGVGNGVEDIGLDPVLAGSFPISRKIELNPGAYFDDMPWLNTPQDRQAIFIQPWRPQGGLLGGSEGTAGMSKLQKLAAARKKKNEEKKEQERTKQTEKDIEKLSLSDKPLEDQMSVPPLAKRQKLVPPSEEEPGHTASIQPVKSDGTDEIAGKATEPEDQEDVLTGTVDAAAVVDKAAPSAFARTLFGSAPGKRPSRDVFPMPYTSSSSYSSETFSEPSPDDIVFAAQAKAGKKAPGPSKTSKKDAKEGENGRKEDLSDSVSSLKISEAPPPKNKGLDVVKEFEKSSNKRSISFVVVGHVDAGKSTLMGRLLLELKHVEQRTVDKYRRQAEKTGKQSFALAWVMDQRAEERDRGVTIDIATNFFETEQTKFTILDAPGHRDFVPNMIAGASQADFAILVIDANTGAYEKGLKGQTKEHVLLLRSIGVQRIVVAVNKLDMVEWSKGRFDAIIQEVSGFLTGLGFQEKHVSFVPISGLNGDNIVKPIEDKAASWYTGSTLLEALESSEPSSARALTKPLRMAISEVFRSQQGTTTLSGRIDSGTMQVGDVLVVQPSGETAYIKSIVVDKDTQDWAVAGQNVNLALTDIDPIHIRVGDILCHPTDSISCDDSFTMRAMAFEHLLPSPVDLHRGRLHAPGRIQSLVATLDKATGDVVKKKPQIVQPGSVARITIKLESKVPLEAGQRVVIRSGGETIAAGLLE
ncbi:unnamed protein product [Clonostachys byssicola]|uniref:Elongation factor 1 alpha-like protein n=1 Tax=Clonostachys byssicola TaxID=160290 RepID=A0A9N9UIX9_9HYPO|nr:unnamed protein product [Clonostachys byssicola]